jgi:hypothetical protein
MTVVKPFIAFLIIFAKIFASLAQLVEQLIRNEQVVGSSPIGGSKNLKNAQADTPRSDNISIMFMH